MFKEAKLKLPDDNSTTDDLRAWAIALTKDTNKDGKTDVFGYLPCVAGSQCQETWLRFFGGHPMTPDGKKSAINSPEALKCITFLYNFYNVDKVVPRDADMPSGGTYAMFAAKNLASFSSGAWAWNSTVLAVEKKFAFSVFASPKGPSGYGWGGYVDSWAMTTQSKHKAEAFKVMYAMACYRSGILRLSLREALTAMPSVYEDPQFKDNRWVQMILKVVKLCKPQIHAWNFRGAEHATALDNGLAPLWLDKAKPTKEFLDKLAEVANGILSKPR